MVQGRGEKKPAKKKPPTVIEGRRNEKARKDRWVDQEWGGDAGAWERKTVHHSRK